MQHTENSSNQVTTSKPSLVRRIFQYVLFSILFLFLIVALALVVLQRHLESNETKIFKELAFLNDGGVAFDRASISVFKNFPRATISLENVVIQDSLFEEHETPLLQVGELSAAVSLQKLLDYHIEIKSLHLQDGVFNMFKDSVNYNNLKALLRREKANSNEVQPNDDRTFKIETDGLKIDLSNIKFNITRAGKGMSVRGCLNQLSTQLTVENEIINAPMHLDAEVLEMVFSAKEGAYLKQSTVSGPGELQIKDGVVGFEGFDLKINEEPFLVNGAVYTRERNRLTLVIEKEATHWDKSVPLLPLSLQKEVASFYIAEPFYTKTTINTFPGTGKSALANIEFVLRDNEVTVENYLYKKVNLEGHFVNRMYENGVERTDVSHEISTTLKNVTARYKGVNLQTEQALITSEKEQGIWIYTKLNLGGKAARISDFLQNDQFFFQKGVFDATVDIASRLEGYIAMAIASKVRMTMRDFAVFYQPADVAFPFKELTLEKEAGDANFKIIGSTFRKDYNYFADGGMKNFPALILDLAGERAESEVNFHAKKLGWTDFIDLFGENGYLTPEKSPTSKTDSQKKQSMKETLRGLQYDFQPSLSVTIDTLEYYDKVDLNQFITGVHFTDANTLVLEKTSFRYGDGQVSLNASLDISKKQTTPFKFELHADKINLQSLLPALNYFNIKLLSQIENLPENVSMDIKHQGILDDEKGLLPNTSTGEIVFSIDDGKTLAGKVSYQSSVDFATKNKLSDSIVRTKINLEGLPDLFNNFFKTEQFFFEKGKFAVEIEYEGDVKDLGEMLNKGEATFNMYDSQIYYEPGDVTFPITQIDLKVKEDTATFELQLKSDSLHQKIDLIGDIHNLSELILGNTGKSLSTMAKISAPRLSFTEIEGFLVNSNTSLDSTKSVKSSVMKIFTTFNPNIHLMIDSFIYSDHLSVEQLKTGLYMLDNNTLVLDKTGFIFQEGTISLNGQIDLIEDKKTPFKAIFQVEDLDAAGLLEGLNYLALPSLQNMKNLSGQVSLHLDLAGMINKEGTALIPEYNKGVLEFSLNNLEIEGYPPLDKIAAKTLMKKRFAKLRFAPIVNVFTIDGTEIDIPLMEIQSNAINLFVEGQLSYGDATNIWVSIPLYNLLFSDSEKLSKKQGYYARNMKIHVEVSSDEAGDNQFNIHLTRKKFYEDRGGKEQFKADKRENRQLRKALRRKD